MAGIDSTAWSARWLGTITADYTETYTFYTTADDGVRLWVNGQLLIDHLNNTGTDSYSATIGLVAGQTYSFRMDYQQRTGDANVKLEWSSASQAREVVSVEPLPNGQPDAGDCCPGEQDGIGDQPIVFSELSGNAISLTELHYDQSLETIRTVKLTATKGTLAVGSAYESMLAGDNNSSSITAYRHAGPDQRGLKRPHLYSAGG